MKLFFQTSLLFSGLLIFLAQISFAQEFTPIYDESKIPEYTLPKPLVTIEGKKVNSAKKWYDVRRPEIVKLFEDEVYGRVPEGSIDTKVEVLSENSEALFGKAHRKEVRISFEGNGKKLKMDLLLYLPKGDNPSPVFLGLNFRGNHTIHHDPEINITDSWVNMKEDDRVVHKATALRQYIMVTSIRISMMIFKTEFTLCFTMKVRQSPPRKNGDQ
jgi:hypothetical protein